MDEDFELIETIFKGIFLAVTCWIWIPALLMVKLYNKLLGWTT